MIRLGIDVGSTTVKMVAVDEGKTVFSNYQRHNTRPAELLRSYITSLLNQVGDRQVSMCLTGSVGMATAEQIGAEFIQEVVAATAYARRPDNPRPPRTLVDIGGEDAKVVFFDGQHTELRMNGNCAGGTGAFIDQMAQLMGVTNTELNDLALNSTRLYPLAARCGVFAKTDIQNLMSRGASHEDIAASIFHAISVQTVTTLSHGCQFHTPILLCGGPLTFMSALRKAFADYLGLAESDMIVSPDSTLIPAMGCALRSGKTTARLSDILARLDKPLRVVRKNDLQPLFHDETEHAQWLKEKQRFHTPIHEMKPGTETVVLGIDSGSTTTKLIAARPNGDILFSHYAPNLGNPVKAAADGMKALAEKALQTHTTLQVVGSCSTGYGEELIKAAFSFDNGIIETMAHYSAAARLMPGVSFILDIGGQDMKAIFVDHGAVGRMELNEACSSGCGTFLETFASSLGYSAAQFAQMACCAPAPCDLGTRCTVFMNSKIKQVLREGATAADISAGLAYSVINNCLYKVLKLKNTGEMGDNIVVQGGTMRNDAVVRAFECLTHRTVARSNMPEMMGAYGCALYAAQHLSAPRHVEDMLAMSSFESRQLHCKGCQNQCQVTQYTFAGGNKYYSGNRCERVFNNKGRQALTGKNIYDVKYRLLFQRENPKTEGETRRRIGIPRVLNLYEDYPFWHTLLTACGFDVVLSPESDFRHYEAALHSVMSDNICFPAKLVHSHIAALQQMDVERILMPYVVYERRDGRDAINSYNCPIVSGYSDVVRSAMTLQVPVDSPVITFADDALLGKQVTAYLKSLGVKSSLIRPALEAAIHAQRDFARTIRRQAQAIYDESRANGRLTIVLAGRPYHTDPLIQHRLSSMIAGMGVDVISDDIVRDTPQADEGSTHLVKQWAYMNRIIKAAAWSAGQGAQVQFVQMTSFGCGPDAFLQDEIRDILYRHNKPYTLLKIDDVSNLGSLKLRVRSLLESLGRQSDGTAAAPAPFVTTRPFRRQDARRKILAPFISEYLTPLIPPLARLAGYDVEVLPPSDRESANLGLQYANNEVCYPATLIVGDIIKALRSGRYAQDDIAVAMSQTGGQCRATNYAGLIKRAMVSAGFKDIPLITLGVSSAMENDNGQQSLEINWRRLAPAVVNGLLYADIISKYFSAAVVREKVAGAAARLRDEFLGQGAALISQGLSRRLTALAQKAARRFDAIVQDRPTLKVGIVGEIFLKFNHFAHLNITEWLTGRGVEVVPPLITPFFLQDFVNREWQQQLHLTSSHTPRVLIRLLYRLASHRIAQFNKAGAAFRYFTPFTDIYHDAAATQGIISPAAQFGEGWLLPADVLMFADSGVKNVLSLQPFGCIANHIIARGIEKALQRRRPDLNLLSLDFDSGVSEVNVTNRLLLFLDQLSA